MTERMKGLLVHFEEDYREDDVEALKDAILLMKGITKVEAICKNMDDTLNRERVRLELRVKLFKLLDS